MWACSSLRVSRVVAASACPTWLQLMKSNSNDTTTSDYINRCRTSSLIAGLGGKSDSVASSARATNTLALWSDLCALFLACFASCSAPSYKFVENSSVGGATDVGDNDAGSD